LSGAERRKNPRVAVDVPVRLIAEGITHEARIKDICRDAVLVEAARHWPLETEVGLRMELPGMNETIEVSGRVIRLVPNGSGPQGMAILFGNVSPLIGLRIEFFVALLTDLSGATGGPPAV
jgi:hypothetical protein